MEKLNPIIQAEPYFTIQHGPNIASSMRSYYLLLIEGLIVTIQSFSFNGMMG